MKQFLILLAFSISCSSYQEYYDKKPQTICASDKNNNSVICDIKIELKTNDWRSYQNYIVIEQYNYKLNNIKKSVYQLILTISVRDNYYYDSVDIIINNDKHYVLTPSKQNQDKTSGLLEILYFNIDKDFIKIMANAYNISILTLHDSYNIKGEDISAIQEFYRSLND